MMLRIAAEGILLLLAWKPTGRAALRDISATAQQVNIRLQYPDMPLVKATKGKMTMVPMELLMVKENQRYNYKMDEKQTANMIKFAVTAPPERWAHIEHGQKMLDWSGDPVLQK
jgi:eukaryotic translation initiation factor 2C